MKYILAVKVYGRKKRQYNSRDFPEVVTVQSEKAAV